MTILTLSPQASSLATKNLLKLTVNKTAYDPKTAKLNFSKNANQRLGEIVRDKKMADSGRLGKDTICQSKTNSKENKDLSKSQANRRSAYALKKTSAKLLPAERVSYCLSQRIDADRGVGVRYNKTTGKASYGNLQLCGSVWVCPCCSARILAKRGNEVEKGVETWTQAGGSVFMLTLTHSHKRTDNLALKMKLLQKALSRFFGDRSMKAIFNQFGKVGQIKALETTYSEANGFHPHHHILMFSKMSPDEFLSDTVSVTFDENKDVEYVTPYREKQLIKDGRIDDIKQVSFEYFIKSYWVKICRAVGLGVPSLKRGVTVQDAGSVKTYLTKFKTAQELTNAQAKRGKNDSRNQWEILADAHNGCAWSGKLWQTYAKAFKTQRQLFWSRGLKEMLLIAEIADDEIKELEGLKDDEYVDILNLGVEDWGYIRKKNWEAQLLDIVEDDQKQDRDNLSIFIYSIKKLVECERVEKEQKERERIASLCPPQWFSEVIE